MKAFLITIICVHVFAGVIDFIYLATGNYPRQREPVRAWFDALGLLICVGFAWWSATLLKALP